MLFQVTNVVNHVRTLLLNRSGRGRPSPNYYLEEFIEPDFAPVRLPSVLQEVGAALVEPGSDNAFANFRCQQYTRLLHATEFAQYVYALDPRVTYIHELQVRKASVKVNGVNTDAALTFAGSISADVGNPRLINNWTVEASSPLDILTTHRQSQETADTVVEFDTGVSSAFAMAGQTNFFSQIRAASCDAGDRWEVESFSEPEDDLTDVQIRLESLSAEALADLFPVRGHYPIFEKLWTRHALLSYRMSGLLLAFAYRAEEVRVG